MKNIYYKALLVLIVLLLYKSIIYLDNAKAKEVILNNRIDSLNEVVKFHKMLNSVNNFWRK